ncbi:MAG: DUF6159 family protein [Aureispira sp.]
MSRARNGWQLAKTSLHIIKENKALIVFPLLSGFSLVLILATFFGGSFLFLDNILGGLESSSERSQQIIGIVFIFFYYLINYFIVVYFNAGLVHCTRRILDGNETSVGEGIRYANDNIGRIFTWAVVSATVGTLLQLLSRTGKVGEFVANFIGFGWSVLTFFVVPVLLYEDHSVVDSVKRSGRILKEKWGSSLVGNASLGLFQLVAFLVLGIVAYLLINVIGVWGILPVAFVGLLIVVVFSAANTIFMTAVYNRVTDHEIRYFDSNILDAAFRAK